jgi:hypothetical protein
MGQLVGVASEIGGDTREVPSEVYFVMLTSVPEPSSCAVS